MRVGIHTSIAGALANAAHRAHEIGCDTLQIFSASPRGWRTGTHSAEACEKFCETRAGYKLLPLAIHANYLINLAAADPGVRLPSVAAFRREMQRAVSLRAEYVACINAAHGDIQRSRCITVERREQNLGLKPGEVPDPPD